MAEKRKFRKPITISAKEIRSQLGEIINRVSYGYQPYVITRRDKPAVVMLSIDEYEDLLDAVDTLAEQRDRKFQDSLELAKEDFQAHRGIELSSKEEIKEFFENLK